MTAELDDCMSRKSCGDITSCLVLLLVCMPLCVECLMVSVAACTLLHAGSTVFPPSWAADCVNDQINWETVAGCVTLGLFQLRTYSGSYIC
jgi:hypothetical protein